MKKCVIIGGGVVGLCSAYYLAKAGNHVTIIDASDMEDGCSYGNAGMIVPSHVIPMAQPGMIAKGVKWMFNSKSPFYVRPRLSSELLKWGYQFYRYANQKHVEASMPALRDLSLLSKELYQEFAEGKNDFAYEEKGLLMLYRTDKVGEEEIHAGKEAEKMGLKVDFLDKEATSKLESGLDLDVIGSVHYKSDAHLIPNNFNKFLKDQLVRLGVKLQTKTIVEDFTVFNQKITKIATNQGEFLADEVVLSAGSWSPMIARKLGIQISILPGKGYSFNLTKQEQAPTIPSILCEGKVAVTPMGDQIRFGGTLEVTHTKDHKINLKRVQGIVNTINAFYPNLQIEQPKKEEIWHGFRPCTPTGLPLISRSTKVSNFILATGHAMMGLSLAPATGKLVEELVGEKKLSVSNNLF